MPLELEIEVDRITPDDVVEVYKRFCEAYRIEASRDDERFLREQGVDRLRSNWGIDYKPRKACNGAKFYMHLAGRGVRVWGCADGYGYDDDSSRLLENSLSEYFSSRRLGRPSSP